MNKTWSDVVERLGLYRKDNNSMWYSDMAVFCDYTKKQIYNGYIIYIEGSDKISICSMEYFFEKLSHQLFARHDYIYIKGITSSALPIKKTRSKERRKVTASDRYRILKRDNFRCVACGAKAGDIELQIDHIVPISKGGLTTDDNLQALCVTCNIGKSNVY